MRVLDICLKQESDLGLLFLCRNLSNYYCYTEAKNRWLEWYDSNINRKRGVSMDWNIFWAAFGAIGTTIGSLITASAVVVAVKQYKQPLKKIKNRILLYLCKRRFRKTNFMLLLERKK